MSRLHWEQLSPTENSKTATSEMSRLHWEQLSPTENSKTATITYRIPRQKCRGFIGNDYHLQKTVKHVRNVEASLGTTITYRKQ